MVAEVLTRTRYEATRMTLEESRVLHMRVLSPFSESIASANTQQCLHLVNRFRRDPLTEAAVLRRLENMLAELKPQVHVCRALSSVYWPCPFFFGRLFYVPCRVAISSLPSFSVIFAMKEQRCNGGRCDQGHSAST